MMINNMITPASGSHSIKEAVITLFLANPIIKPERFEILIKDQFKDLFQKFEKVNQIQFQVKGNGLMESPMPEIQENIGFRFQKFEEGKLVVALQGVNEVIRNFMSYHSLNYSRWETFFSDFKDSLLIVSDFHKDLFVTAFSLHYIDEFIWEGGDEIDPFKVFNKDSTLLPKEFFDCKLNNYQFTTIKKNKYEYFDRFEIKVDERPKKFITISHNVLSNFNDTIELKEMLQSDDFKEMIHHAHSLNKKTLFNVLTTDVCSLIKLSQ